MPDLVLPDVSEFQSVDFTVFSGPIIVRAHNGRRADYHWLQHAAGASAQRWWGAYQYLPSNVGAGLAAQRFLDTLGTFRPNVTILDLEEGTGDQQGRQHDWLTVMADDPARDWTYSGDYFARAHGLTNVDWIAAYQKRTPTTAHELWQFTDKQPFSGIGECDASVFLGTVDDLIALTSNTAPAPTPSEDDELTNDQWKALQGLINAVEDKDNGVLARVARIEGAIGQSDANDGPTQTGLAGSLHKARKAIKRTFAAAGGTGDPEA